ncbi:MAG: hypothetical protein ABFD75_07245 [Smithella sp.]
MIVNFMGKMHKYMLLISLSICCFILGGCNLPGDIGNDAKSFAKRDNNINITNKAEPAKETQKVAFLGNWVNFHYYGNQYDQSGNLVSDSYIAKCFEFRNDGTCQFMAIYKGTVLPGGILVQDAKYKVQENQIYIYEVTESWDPAPNNTKPAYKNRQVDALTLTFSYNSGTDTLTVGAMAFERNKYLKK